MKFEYNRCPHCGMSFFDDEVRYDADRYCMPVCRSCYDQLKTPSFDTLLKCSVIAILVIAAAILTFKLLTP